MIDDAVLNYGSKTNADSIFVALKGRSTVASKDKDAINQIGHLEVSGNMEYFKRKLIGKGVDVVVRP